MFIGKKHCIREKEAIIVHFHFQAEENFNFCVHKYCQLHFFYTNQYTSGAVIKGHDLCIWGLSSNTLTSLDTDSIGGYHSLVNVKFVLIEGG